MNSNDPPASNSGASNSKEGGAGAGGGDADATKDKTEATKRLAKQGQWRTPPLPVFAASSVGSSSTSKAPAPSANNNNVPVSIPGMPAALPTTPDEYARMLEEAYRRGAEAGARATQSAQKSQPTPTASQAPPNTSEPESIASSNYDSATNAKSCPNLSQLAPANSASPSNLSVTATTPGMPPPPTVQYMAPPPPPAQHAGHAAAPISTSVQPANYQTVPTAPITSTQSIPTVSSNTSTLTQASHTSHTTYSAPVAVAVSSAVASVGGASASRSVSLPDMSSYAAHANDEEEKRKKRLARNRASARLRRLKKKNLVDSYEGEVGILESALSKLRSHSWGAATLENNHEALIDALSMERGQQPLTTEKRRELIQSIVMQQREQVANLMECQLENWMLSQLASFSLSSPIEADAAMNNITSVPNPMMNGGTANNLESNGGGANDEDLKSLTSELQSILQLTPVQIQRIQQASQGCDREVQDLFTVDNCLKSIHDNKWLLDEGVDDIAGQFTSILNPTQLSKFLMWSDHNADSIEKLDYVNVGVGVESSPVFEFGIDEGADGGD